MRTAGALLAAGACLASLLALGVPAHAQNDGWFVQRPFPEQSWTLDDLGVVDHDQDGDLDVFTTNHISTQLLLANDGSGSFQDRLTASRLNQTPAFPGWEDDPNVPELKEPGLYMYRASGPVLRLIGPPDQAVSGELRFLAPVTVQQSSGAQLALSRDSDQEPQRHVLRFSMVGDAIVRLKQDGATLPFDVSIDSPFPLQQVFVGRREVNPTSRGFLLYLRDRHGMAWADYDGDGRLDVFITRGGISGNIKRYKGLVQDELLLGSGSGFQDAIAGRGIKKGNCRGRGAAATDYNRDGRLDVFAACYRDNPKLFRQRANGTFKNVSGKLASGGVGGSAFAWLDLDDRGAPELIAARRHRFVVYRHRKKRWKRADALRGRHVGSVQKLAVADYDNDGDPDVFAASRNGNTLLVGRRGRLHRKNPKSVGLPSRALTANWVDYDNDGRADMHVIPRGLYRQKAGHRFSRTPLARPGGSPAKATAGWFDFDANGSRDAVLAVRHKDAGRSTSLRLLDNAGPVGHWLEVELTGPPGNRQALGAKVRARTPGRRQTQWVGQNDGSHLSQGHYRLYFGLGAATGAGLEVRWPDGTVRKLDVPADRIVRLTQRT